MKSILGKLHFKRMRAYASVMEAITICEVKKKTRLIAADTGMS